MPRLFLMTWEPKSRRWRKLYKGKLYTVLCRSLGEPESKEEVLPIRKRVVDRNA